MLTFRRSYLRGGRAPSPTRADLGRIEKQVRRRAGAHPGIAEQSKTSMLGPNRPILPKQGRLTLL